MPVFLKMTQVELDVAGTDIGGGTPVGGCGSAACAAGRIGSGESERFKKM